MANIRSLADHRTDTAVIHIERSISRNFVSLHSHKTNEYFMSREVVFLEKRV